MLKRKETEDKLLSHLTGNLKSFSQSSIKEFVNKSSPENKGKLNMNTSESCIVVRSFNSCWDLSPKLRF